MTTFWKTVRKPRLGRENIEDITAECKVQNPLTKT